MATLDTGWLPFGTIDFNPGWTNATAGNLNSQNGTSATLASGNFSAETPYARMYNVTGLAAALATATAIVGIEVRFYGVRTGTLSYDYLNIRGFPSGSPQSVTAKNIVLPTSAGYVTVGGPTDLHGGKSGGPWAVSDFTDGTIGVGFAWAGNPLAISLDSVEFRVYATIPDTPRRLALLGVGS